MATLEFKRLSPRDILHVIFKRKNQILLFFVATICTVVIGTFITKPTYEAGAQVLVKVEEKIFMFQPSGGNDPIISFNRDEQINSEIELLKSRSLVEKVVESLGAENIYKDVDHTGAVLRLQKKLWIGKIEKSNVIAISFKHKDPQRVAQIVNALTDAFLEQHLLVHKNPQSYNFFEEQSQILKNKLKQSEETLKVLKKQHNVTALGEEQRLLLKQIADLRSELNRTINQEAETKSRINQIRRQLDRTPETIPQGEEVDHNPTILTSNLEAKLVELQIKQKELLTRYTPQSRLVQNVKEEINMVRAKLAEQETKRYGKSSTGLNTTHQRLKEELFRNQAEREALAAKKETQKTQLTNFQEKLEQFNQIEVELNRLQQTIDVDRQNYRLYLAKFEEARISEAMDSKKITNVSVIEPAHAPLEPVSPKVSLNILLGLFLGGFGGLGLAFFIEYLDDSLEKPEDVEKALHLPVLASIPELEMGKIT